MPSARSRACGVASLLLVLAFPALPALPGCARAEDAALRNQQARHADVPQQLLTLLNAARAERGLAPLRLHPALMEFALRRARETSARGNLAGGRRGHSKSIEELRADGYEPQLISEVYAQVSGTPAEVVAGWRGQGDETWAEVLRADWRDLGIGVATLADQPLYALVFAQPRADYFAIETSDLSDLEQVRSDLLAAVNRARSARRLQPLRISATLNRAAQRYAELMLETGHYGHAGPRGESSLDRAVGQGYLPRMVGENLARGQLGVEDVMTGWLESPDHRRNILGVEYQEAGFGIALGRGPGGFDVYWVQLFGTRR